MNKGNGAREKVQQFFDEEFLFMLHDADKFLLWLAVKGYVIVPLTADVVAMCDEETVQ